METLMDNRIHELLHRNLQEVFGEGDAARRRAAIDELYTEDCVLDVPPGTFIGREALDKFADDLRATHPPFHYTPHGEPQALHNAGRLAWGSGPRGEAPNYTGLDVIVVRDDRIAALFVFLDSSSHEEEIRRRAYEIYLARGGDPGHDSDDWLQAEREISIDSAHNAAQRGGESGIR